MQRETTDLVPKAGGIIEPSNQIEIFYDSIVESRVFSYYLPSVLKSKDGFATVIFFDPQGNGTQPLSRYAEMANNLDLLLVGSSVSQNGLTMDVIF